MDATRWFLDWDGPPPDKVADWLLDRAPAALPDLGDWMVLVPTRQAGRRLRQALATRAGARGRALLPPRILTPPVFWAAREADGREAGPLLETAAWQAVLAEADTAALAALFPAWPDGVPAHQRRPLADLVGRLRSTLAEAGLTLADAAGRPDVTGGEDGRWAALAALERDFLARLRALGLEDAASREIRLALAPDLPPGVRQVALAALPDPTPLLIGALRRVAGRLPLHVLVHAPAARAAEFDGWGRPLASAWTAAVIPVPDPARSIRLCTDLAAQADAAVEALARAGAPAALGLPDPALRPHLERALEARGNRLRDTAGRPVAGHPLPRVLELLRDLAREPRCDTVLDLLRHADVLAHAARATGAAAGDLLAALHETLGAHLPRRLPDLLAFLPREAEAGDTPRHALATTLRRLAALAARLRDEPPATAVPAILAELLAGRAFDPARPADARFLAVAERLREGLEEFTRPAWQSLAPAPLDQLDLLLADWSGQRLPEPAEPGAVDAEGWLELAWHPAPALVITGLHEGRVPGGLVSDPFLPDAARRALGLRADEDRLARDAFLLCALLAARPAGAVTLLCSRTGDGGDPLKPSRLLFRCPDAELPARAAQLLAAPEAESTGAAPRAVFRLDPAAFPPRDFPAIGVSALRDYLACPFLFFLRHVARLREPVPDGARELDAAAFGSLAHECLRDFGREASLRDSADAESIAAFLGERLDRLLAGRFGPRPSLAVEFQRHSLRQRLEAFARAQAEQRALGWRIRAVEVPVELVLGGVTVRGTVDRVDEHASGALRVLDYKTSEKPTAPEKAHLGRGSAAARPHARARAAGLEGLVWRDLQLPLYARMLSGGRAPGVEAGYVQLPAAVSHTAFRLWPDFTPAVVADAVDCAGRVLERIRAGAFADTDGFPSGDHDPFDLPFGGDPAAETDLAALRGAPAPGEPA